MNAKDLLLTDEEQREAVRSIMGSLDPLCRAQAKKVLAALEADAARRLGFQTVQFLRDIIAETGLAWPPKEG